MSKKKKPTANPIEERQSEDRNENEEVSEYTAEWLFKRTTHGNFLTCSSCNAHMPIETGTVLHQMEVNRYCFNCGARMIIKDGI